MIEARRLADDQIELVVRGKLDKSDIESAITELEAAQVDGRKLNVLVDLSAFSGMTMEAFIADVRYGITHLKALDGYDRLAVITDADWIEAMVWIESKIFRRVDIRAFETDERDEAIMFMNGEEPPERGHRPGVVRIPAKRDDIIAFRITDKIRENDAKAMFGILTDAYEHHGKIDLMIVIEDFEGFDPKMVFQGDVWSGKMKAMSHVPPDPCRS